MSSNRPIDESASSEQEPIRQKGISDGSRFSKKGALNEYLIKLTEDFSFDGVSLGLIGVVCIVGIGLAGGSVFSVLPLQEALMITITLLTSVFTLLSVRENKRDRETSVEPTLFVARQGEEYGILNLGNGPAHELSVTVAGEYPDDCGDWDDLEPEEEDKVLRVDRFLLLKKVKDPKYVHMEYRSNVGYKEYNVTREVLSEDD